ncbi:CHAD domain-containing protein [Ottowia sp. GY511]|uniref:CHAD domain-containing protein n=1 Tax=Ottowia flava TaxID=2675430 RepID=A0ABW4KTN2_9BURK|nr:CHAD domain-containing protein [Ottowia sp. GY511]TXK26836.1 CHAD domain-containing protein [Ottowia sp. GY511]
MSRRTPSSPPASAADGPAQPQETELKLALPGADPARIGEQLAALPGLAGVRVSEQRLTNTYFDTPDQALHRARAALRIRRLETDGAPVRWLQTLKTADGASGGLSQRGEWETPLADHALDRTALQATPPWAALDADGALWPQLAPAFATEATRTLRALPGADGSRIELVLDIGRVRAPAATSVDGASAELSVDLCELELELLEGQPDALFALADQIAQHIPVLPASLSKAERGWRLLAGTSHAPRRARTPPLTRQMTVTAAAQAVLGEALGQFLDNLGGILHADGSELVHQARVGWRRWRSALWLFKPLLGAHPLPHGAALGPLLKALGSTRDLDVAGLESLPLWSDAYVDGDPERAEQWQAMEAAVLAERRIRRAGLLAVLQTPPTGRALLQLERWLHALPQAVAQTEGAQAPLAQWARERTQRLHRRLKHEVRELDTSANAPEAPGANDHASEHQHRVRLLAKRTRYVLQGLAEVLPERRTRRWAEQATELQTRIGAARDLMLLATLLEPIGVDRAILGFLRGVAAGRLADG